MARRMFNVLAEEPGTVAAVLVPRIRTVKVRATVHLYVADVHQTPNSALCCTCRTTKPPSRTHYPPAQLADNGEVCVMQGASTSIEFLNPVSAALRVIGGVPQIISGGRFFDKHGDRVRADGYAQEPTRRTL